MGWDKFLDSHVEKGLILSGLFFADPGTPRIEFLIPFEKQNDLGIIGDFFGKLRMLSEIPIELHPQQAVSLFEDSQGRSPFSPRRRGHGFKADERHLRSRGEEVQLFETDDLALVILHEDDKGRFLRTGVPGRGLQTTPSRYCRLGQRPALFSFPYVVQHL